MPLFRVPLASHTSHQASELETNQQVKHMQSQILREEASETARPLLSMLSYHKSLECFPFRGHLSKHGAEYIRQQLSEIYNMLIEAFESIYRYMLSQAHNICNVTYLKSNNCQQHM